MIGIYRITNPKGQIYIGSSKNITTRWSAHKSLAKHNRLKTNICQSLIKYGHENHIFEVLEECEEKSLLKLERFYQTKYKSYEKPHLNTQKANNFINGKKVYISTKKDYYLDVNTGVFYNSVYEIADLYGMFPLTLNNQITGKYGNKKKTRWIKV